MSAEGSGAEAGSADDKDDGYNKGTEEDLRKALDSVYDYNKVLITLATGTIALSATFLGKDLYQGVQLWLLATSWIVLGASIVSGVVALGDYINQYAESSIRPRRSTIEYFSLAQVLGLIIGLALLTTFAIQNAAVRPVGTPTVVVPSVTPTTSR